MKYHNNLSTSQISNQQFDLNPIPAQIVYLHRFVCIIHELYKQTYADKQFVRVLDLGQIADLKFVKYSNYCDISLHMDAHTHTLIVVSCIDNMVKGAAGQAIQNMNIMYHFEEDSGLKSIAPSF